MSSGTNIFQSGMCINGMYVVVVGVSLLVGEYWGLRRYSNVGYAQMWS